MEPTFDDFEVHPDNIQMCSKLGEGEFGTVHIAKVKIDAMRKYRDLFRKMINDDTEEYIMAAVKVLNGMLINIIVNVAQINREDVFFNYLITLKFTPLQSSCLYF